MNINECGCRPYGWLGLDGNRCIRVIPRQSCYVSLNNTTIRYLHVQTLILATPQLLEMAAQPHSFKYLHHHICVYMRVIMCQAVAVNIHNE